MRAATDKGIDINVEGYVAELETLLRHRDKRGPYKHLKRTVGLGRRKIEGQQAIKDENGNLLRDAAVGEVFRQSAQHQVSRTPTIHRREDTAAEEGTAAAAARSAVENRETNITRGRANVRGDATCGRGDGKLESAGR